MREFRLSPRGRGISCDEDGAFIGVIPLLRRSEIAGTGRWEPQDRNSLSRRLSAHFGLRIDMSRKMGGLRAIARALNDGEIARAQIATVLLGIPDPLPLAKGTHSRGDMIRFIRDLEWSGLIKADWDSNEHPRWPAGAPDSQGGEFAPRGRTVAGVAFSPYADTSNPNASGDDHANRTLERND